MLSCVHDPCINCAASAYAEQVYIKGQSKEVRTISPRYTSAKFVEKRRSSTVPPSQNSPPSPAQSSNCPARTLPLLRAAPTIHSPHGKSRRNSQSTSRATSPPPSPPRKSSTIASSTPKKKYPTIASPAGPTSAPSAPSTVSKRSFRLPQGPRGEADQEGHLPSEGRIHGDHWKIE
jgi:hypothetical protein